MIVGHPATGCQSREDGVVCGSQGLRWGSESLAGRWRCGEGKGWGWLHAEGFGKQANILRIMETRFTTVRGI